MSKYTDIFFDMDDTIWDFSRASSEALRKVYDNYELSKYFEDFQEFKQIFEEINKDLWEKYRRNEVQRETVAVVRFIYTLEKKTRDFPLMQAQRMSDSYLAYTVEDAYLEPFAHDTIRYLRDKGYRIHIISDGFFEVQIMKVKMAKIASYVSHLISAEEVGVLKPDPRIFEYAVNKANTTKEKSIFIGNDYENDVLGARNAGLDQVFYNKKKIDVDSLPVKPTYTVQSLKELWEIF